MIERQFPNFYTFFASPPIGGFDFTFGFVDQLESSTL
jgi:hypothetical protein